MPVGEKGPLVMIHERNASTKQRGVHTDRKRDKGNASARIFEHGRELCVVPFSFSPVALISHTAPTIDSMPSSVAGGLPVR